ncbi:YaeQ protein [hydrothermal vent metagenome]|uniref:YaeQ protein n=1 Tax=hydrothermal vent metagenome TaxID=652676 RepID=A0A3B1CTA9_9ZZZZ
MSIVFWKALFCDVDDDGDDILALKPTIYKVRINLSDLDRNYYDTFHLTLAQHPSETLERMMVRVLAFCINAQASLVFTKGLCAVEDPDIWARTLDDQISLWIDVGEPSFERMKKARRLSPIVKIYSFNSKSHRWWTQGQTKFKTQKVSIFQFEWKTLQTLSALVKRTMDLSITITCDTAYVSAELGTCEVPWSVLQSSGL